MNSRVLELLKDPKNIQSEDIQLLKGEIDSFPYIQNIRALHLYGVHLFDQENYQKELSVTAAYTTDKKILYQLINGKLPEIQKPKKTEETHEEPEIETAAVQTEEIISSKEEQKQEEKEPAPLPTLAATNKLIMVNGERNRILFEGEENFLNEENPETIDLESTVESGVIVTQKQENLRVESSKLIDNQKEIASDTPEEAITPEVIINEDKISTEEVKEEVSDSSELSFHGTDSFLPEVTIQPANNEEPIKAETPQTTVNKHEEEMRRLIEEVEKKMKLSKDSAPEKKDEKETETDNYQISFAETQSFHVETEEPVEKPLTEEVSNNHEEKVNDEVPQADHKKEENPSQIQEVRSAWKPMAVESHLPDSLIHKKEAEINTPKPEEPVLLSDDQKKEPEAISNERPETVEVAKENQEPEEETIKDEDAEAPVMNVSFFSSDISNLRINKEEEKVEEKSPKENVESPAPEKSNVPGFINTWQSWLKIDRSEEIEKEKAKNKSKVIDSFIENNPKITQLKEENTYVVREKTDDISHLMTETLANLYLEQKLYTKATNAFRILANKHPERRDYFEDKIQEIKSIRGGSKD
ncbi:hypothetical protein [Chryseobacterium sp. CT-SW4]|uniref:hypothetical protein n=1 Tax=Chryseobacterium sp. SW-1 TaxID=3157343 RepID=UPI003B018194